MNVELEWGVRSHVDVDGVAIHVEQSPGSGPPLALLHGFSSGTFTWAGIGPLLADRQLVAWDRPPFGRSDRPAPVRGTNDPYRVDRVLTEARAVLAAHEVDRPILVGHSAGCLVSAQLVAGGLDVAGVVLIAPAIEGAPPASVRRLASVRAAAPVGTAGLRLALHAGKSVIKAVGRHRTPLMDATAAESARCLRQRGTAEALWHLTAVWQPTTVLDEIGPLDVPLLVIGGSDDRICPPRLTRRVAERLDAELVLLDGVGHAPHEQVPERVAALIEDHFATW